jgi:hypothetical protein
MLGILKNKMLALVGIFAFENAWRLFFNFFHVFVGDCRKIAKIKSDQCFASGMESCLTMGKKK